MKLPAFDRETTLALIDFAEDIPSLPDRFVEIQRVLNDNRSSADDLAEVISRDQATTTMLLKFANSPRFHVMGKQITSLGEAIARLGTREASRVALAMSLVYGIALPSGMTNLRAFWAHSFAVALATERLAQTFDPRQVEIRHETAFIIGLMHDIGRIVLGLRVDFTYFEQQQGHMWGEPLIEVEERNYGIGHAEAGEHLLRRWGFPDIISQSIGAHHRKESTEPYARLCRIGDLFVRKNLPFSTSFNQVPDKVMTAFEKTDPNTILAEEGLLSAG